MNARLVGSAEEGGRGAQAGRGGVRRFYAKLEGPVRQRWRDHYEPHGGQRYMRCHEREKRGRGLHRQRRIDGRVRMLARVTIRTVHRNRRGTTRDVSVIVRSRYAMALNMLGRCVGLGFVLVRMTVRQRRGRRGEPRSDGEHEPEQASEW